MRRYVLEASSERVSEQTRHIASSNSPPYHEVSPVIGQVTPSDKQTRALRHVRVGQFNKLLLDMCDVLWRDQAFLPAKPGSVFELLADPRVEQLGGKLEKDAFSIRRHPALLGHVLRFMKEVSCDKLEEFVYRMIFRELVLMHRLGG